MHGMLFTIQKRIVPNLSPTEVREGFQCYRTSKYKLSYYETPSGIKYVMNTDLNAQGVRELLQTINSQVSLKIPILWFRLNNHSTIYDSIFQIYLEYCVKNPTYRSGEVIQSELFKAKLDELLKQTPIFKSWNNQNRTVFVWIWMSFFFVHFKLKNCQLFPFLKVMLECMSFVKIKGK